MNYFYVFIGSGIGGLLRYILSLVINKSNAYFPIHTFIANGIACMILGYILSNLSIDSTAKFKLYFIATGFCGGLSTFSTFTYELIQLSTSRDWVVLLIYSSMSFSCCLFLTWLGLSLGAKQ